MALLVCDALLALAFENVTHGSRRRPRGPRALSSPILELGSAAGIGGTTAGQAADMASEEDPSGFVSLAALECIHVHKAARLDRARDWPEGGLNGSGM
jgi:geranylgeranyl pyrophosphate synthase